MRFIFYFGFTHLFLKLTLSCDISNSLQGDGIIFYKYIENDTYIIPYSQQYINPSGEIIYAYCYNGFTPLNNWEGIVTYRGVVPLVNNVKISCDSDSPKFENGEDQDDVDFSYLRCLRPGFGYYFTNVSFCPTLNNRHSKGLIHGLLIKDTPIVLAEICYDFQQSKISFLHFNTLKRSLLLEEQFNFNPSSSNEFYLIENEKRKIFLSNSKYIFEDKLDRNVLSSKYGFLHDKVEFFPHPKLLFDSIKFVFDDFIPPTFYNGIFNKYLESETNSIGIIPFWENLKNGNLKIYQRLFVEYATKIDYSVYAGTSDIVQYPKDLISYSYTEDLLLYRDDGQKEFALSIPKYIWYLFELRNKTDIITEKDKFVVIAVNDPFFQVSDIFCQDICDEIYWLSTLRKIRKMAQFGFIFCCKLEDVQDHLKEVPFVKTRMLTSNPIDSTLPDGLSMAEAPYDTPAADAPAADAPAAEPDEFPWYT